MATGGGSRRTPAPSGRWRSRPTPSRATRLSPRGRSATSPSSATISQESLRFYREFLGLDVERGGPNYFLTHGNGGVNAIVVERGDAVLEQTVLNHHGITLWTDDSKIKELHAAAKPQKDAFGIQKIMIATHQHGSYSFYMQDRDTNWWEIEVWDGHVDPWTQIVQKREAGLLKV